AALRAGDWALAERLAANHFLPAGVDAYELDWIAGYAALRAGASGNWNSGPRPPWPGRWPRADSAGRGPRPTG
ncbi:hypothetical protein, partial [Paracoccus sanguinis]|uniref:hypothetical protein n=1 Tax=Paracoccus sanguinis TaxID=1545044 RepID=UPI001E644864